MAITYENQVGYILNLWDDSITFKDDLARIFFAATIVEALEMAHQAGKKAEAKKRKASISARYQQRLTKRAPDARDSARTSSSFLHLSLFLVGQLK